MYDDPERTHGVNPIETFLCGAIAIGRLRCVEV